MSVPVCYLFVCETFCFSGDIYGVIILPIHLNVIRKLDDMRTEYIIICIYLYYLLHTLFPILLSVILAIQNIDVICASSR